MIIDVISEELSFFKAAASRLNWLINAAMITSAMIILHTYVLNFSLQEQQLKRLAYNRFTNQVTIYRECEGSIFLALEKHPDKSLIEREKIKNEQVNSLESCNKKGLSKQLKKRLLDTSLLQIIKEYSNLEYEITRNENTYYDIRLPMQKIPLLDINVPANDFVVIMGVILMLVVIGIWMNLRGVYAGLTALCIHDNIEIIKVAQLNTVFLTYSEIAGNSLSKRIRFFSMWLPFSSIFIAMLVSIWPFLWHFLEPCLAHFLGPLLNLKPQEITTEIYINGDDYNSDLLQWIFLLISISLCSFHYWMALKCYRVMKEIDFVFENKLG